MNVPRPTIFPQTAAPAPGTSVPLRVEIAPGQCQIMQVPRAAVNRYGLVKIMLAPNGELVPAWKSWHTKVRVTRDLPARLGLPVDVETLRALVYAGIVKGTKFSPSLTLIDLDSLATHMEQATGDAAREYWKGAREQAYSEAWQSMHAQGMTGRPRRLKVKPGTHQQGKHQKPKAKAKAPAAAPAPRPVRPAPAADPRQMDLFNP